MWAETRYEELMMTVKYTARADHSGASLHVERYVSQNAYLGDV